MQHMIVLNDQQLSYLQNLLVKDINFHADWKAAQYKTQKVLAERATPETPAGWRAYKVLRSTRKLSKKFKKNLKVAEQLQFSLKHRTAAVEFSEQEMLILD